MTTERKVRVKRTTTATLEEDRIKTILREAVNAPSHAEVRFDGGSNFVDNVEIEWSVEEEES